MKQKLLFASFLVFCVAPLCAQNEQTGWTCADPNTSWTPAYVYYNLSDVASALGYSITDDLKTDLTAAFASEDHTIVVSNIDNASTESTNYTANYWRGNFGCFWLNAANEVVDYGNGNVFWSQVDWNDSQLIIGLGQMAYQNDNTGCAPGAYTAHTKLTNGSNTVVLHSTLNVVPTSPSLLKGAAVATQAAWASSDVVYPITEVAQALGYASAADLKTALDAKSVAFAAKKEDGSYAGAFTSNYTRGSESGYNYGCFFMDEGGAVVDGWQYWHWNTGTSSWELKDGKFAHHFDYDDTSVTVHLMQGNGGCAPGIYMAQVMLMANGKGVTLCSSLVVNASNVSDLTVVNEETVYVQDKPWTDWWEKNWFSMDATALMTETGLDASFISSVLSQLVYSYTDASTGALNSDAATNTTTAIGFWLKGTPGVITPWADGPEFYIDDMYYNTDGTWGGSLGEKPNALVAGSHRTADLYLVCGTKAVKQTVVFDVADVVISEDKNYVPVDATDVTVALSRSMKVGMNTLVLPFDMTQAEVEANFGEGAIVYIPQSFANDNISFTVQSGILANTPCLLKATAASTTAPYLISNRTIQSGTPRVNADKVSMIGSYDAMTTVPANDNNYIVYQKDGTDALYFVNNDKAKMKGTRAYLKVEEASGVKTLNLIFDSATAIESLLHTEWTNSDVYDLSGRKIVNQPLHGLYIINGKKLLIK